MRRPGKMRWVAPKKRPVSCDRVEVVEVAVEARRFGLLADADQYLALALSIQSDAPEWIELRRQ